ncbi:hypothetical protein AB0M94_39535 [Streptomyces xanthochromogenes]|uniref:hypothetical protein n=1 Tax=Streptomyces xanthochromogenes TaxID=67384 RepID=UPI003426F7F3
MDRTDHPILPAQRPAADESAGRIPVTPAPRTYFYVMTVQSPPGPGGAFAIGTYSGTFGAQPGESRQALYEGIRQGVMNQMGSDDVLVLHFTLELNSLDGDAA